MTVAGRSSKSVWPALCLILLGCSVRHIVYPAPPVSVQDPPRRLRAQTWSLGDGTQVSSWVHDERGLVSSRPAVLFLHGNGENLETMRQVGLFEELLALDVPFVALDYPGYGRSTGVPSEASILAAGSVALEWMIQHFGNRPIVVAGWSLGAAVAGRCRCLPLPSLAGGGRIGRPLRLDRGGRAGRLPSARDSWFQGSHHSCGAGPGSGGCLGCRLAGGAVSGSQ